MKLKFFLISLIFVMCPLALQASPREIDEVDLKVLMPSVIRYFDITAYGGHENYDKNDLPGTYKKSELLELGEGPHAHMGNRLTAVSSEKEAWVKIVGDYFPKEEIYPSDLVAFFNYIDLDGPHDLLFKGTKVPKKTICCEYPEILVDRRGAVNPLAYKLSWAVSLKVSHTCHFFPKSLEWLPKLAYVHLLGSTVEEIPDFIYQVLTLEELEIESCYTLKGGRFHEGMSKLRFIKLGSWIPNNTVLKLPALEKIDAFCYDRFMNPEIRETAKKLTEKGVKHKYDT